MSEYMEKHTVSRLVGAPPGYVGYEEGGQLTEPVRRRPYSVILFDEVEKAHPDVWNVLLQVLDDGRLTDGQGRTVDFRNTVIILTSNVGTAQAAAIEESATGDAEKKAKLVRAAVMEEVQRSFRPEFINRLDEIVVFHRLDKAELAKIVEIQLGALARRLARRDLAIDVSQGARELIGELGWDPQYGARPLKRAIQRYLEDPLAQRLLAGEFGPGETIFADRTPDGQLKFERKMLN
jgi:ATP-dependent Clp protease ATP-binding subunit ClpB